MTREAPNPRSSRVPVGRLVLALLGGLICAVAIVLVYDACVASATGQRVDQSALQGARLGRTHVIGAALSLLGLVSALGLVVATCAVVVVAAARRRLDLAIGAGVLVIGANVTSQVVKYGVLDRPRLGIDAGLNNSLPSGHTTVAASLAAAAILVVPTRARLWTALAGMAATGLAGVSTLVAGWHRPSDVIAATLVVGAWSGVVAAGLGAWSRGRQRAPLERGARVTAALLALAGVIATVPAAVAWNHVSGLSDIAQRRRDLFVAYVGGSAAIAAATALVFAFVLYSFAGFGGTRPGRRAHDGVGGGGVDGDGDVVGTVESAAARSTRAFASGA